MKPALYYTLVPQWSRGYGLAVFTVTSEGVHRVYGRTNDHPSNRRKSECIGRFETEDAARTVIEQVSEIDKRFQVKRDELHRELAILNGEERAARKKVLDNV